MGPAERIRNLAGFARLASRLDPDARRALGALAREVAKENAVPRQAPGIDPSALISPLASLRFVDRVEIGPRALVQPYACVWGGWSYTWVRIGEGAAIGTGAALVCGVHAVNSTAPIRETGFEEADVTIGAGAGIGANAVVIGCRIGENAVLGANSVATRDIPDGAIAAGAPARVVDYRHPEYEPAR